MLEKFLERSSVTDGFRIAVNEFMRTGRASDRIRFQLGSPAVKVERTLTKLLEEHPDQAIETVELRAESGCSNFTGVALISTSNQEFRIEFDWDCRWRAEQAGLTDYFGLPDQISAAREFGYDCFRVWNPEDAATTAG